MSLRIRSALVTLPFVLLMTGCFQQAGPELQQSAGVTSEPLIAPAVTSSLPTIPVSTASSLPTEGIPLPTVENIISPASATPGGIAITIISPTRVLPVTPTPLPELPSGDAEGGAGSPTQSQFLTPAQPLSPNPTNTPAPQTPNGQPTSTPSGLITPTALSNVEGGGLCTHTVQPGENLYRIALKYEISLESLRSANTQLSGDLIQPGDVLNIPECVATSADGTVKPTVAPTTISTPLPGSSQTYTVERGDTLYSIALKFGVTIADLQTTNNIDNPNRLAVGQELIIPAPSG